MSKGGAETVGDGLDFRGCHEQEHRRGVHEAADEPGAGDAVHLGARARYPDGAALRAARGGCRPRPAPRNRFPGPPSISVCVPVVQIRIVGVAVDHRRVPVDMARTNELGFWYA